MMNHKEDYLTTRASGIYLRQKLKDLIKLLSDDLVTLFEVSSVHVKVNLLKGQNKRRKARGIYFNV